MIRYFLDRELAKKVIDCVEDPHIETVKKFGMACSLPGSFQGSLHAFMKNSQNAERYKGTIRDIIRAGGCNCSRDYTSTKLIFLPIQSLE